MSDIPEGGDVRRPRRALPSLARLAASPRFQRWAAHFPLTSRAVRREGEAMFDLVAGFVHSQVLQALVELGTLEALREGSLAEAQLAHRARVPGERMRVLVNAGIALGLLRRARGGRIALTLRGAALTGVPGLADMIAHHAVLYRDLADPVAFFRGETEPGLARFWPYVFGAAAAENPEDAARYSRLMAESQQLVADETLDAVALRDVRHLLDIGGGTGAFLEAAGRRWPHLAMTLFDLPAVVPGAGDRFAAAGLRDRVRIVGGSFRDDPLPQGADAISLVRVLYDHAEPTVRALLGKVRDSLPPGGRLIVSEPMAGGSRPTRAGDVYFGVYTLAMETGRARSGAEIAGLMTAAGFVNTTIHRTKRPFVTSVVTARTPA